MNMAIDHTITNIVILIIPVVQFVERVIVGERRKDVSIFQKRI
jgi:hypothetical protein